jgi:hypothetical protein
MQTKEACATRLTFIIAVIVSIAIALGLPAVPAHALTVTICGQTVAGSSATATTVNLGGTTGTSYCGNAFRISAQPGFSQAQAAALVTSGSQNQVVIRNAVITRTGSSQQVVIDASHFFPNVVINSTAQRAYGVGMNATFSRKVNNIGVLASLNRIQKRGFYTYNGKTDQIGGAPQPGGAVGPPIGPATGAGTTLSYGPIATTGSTTQNTIPLPSPSAKESPRNCSNLGAGCANGETLRTELTVTLTQLNDKVTIPGGDHTVSGGCSKKENKNCGEPGSETLTTGFVDAMLASLTAAAQLQQNTPNASINPNDSGFLTVNLLCNVDFRCENVDQASLLFGVQRPPGPAMPVSVKLADINHDGFKDLQIKVDNQQTGIECEDVMAVVTGLVDFPDLGFLGVAFDAPVGFTTGGPTCQ